MVSVTNHEIIAALDALHGSEEEGHKEADKILLEAVPVEIAAAYWRCKDRIGFWYA